MRKELVLPNGSDCKLIPSFFDLLVHLKRSGRSFTVCFRTFGEDLPSVAEDYNNFCEGKHPLYPDVRMDGSDGSPDYRFSVTDGSKTCGTFHRDDNTISLILGTLEQAGEGEFNRLTLLIQLGIPPPTPVVGSTGMDFQSFLLLGIYDIRKSYKPRNRTTCSVDWRSV